MEQLFFDFYKLTNTNFLNEENFVNFAENNSAKNLLSNFFSYQDFAKNPYKSVILTGDSKSGKTHLTHIFSQKFNANHLTANQLLKNNPLNIFLANHFYILDDFDQIENPHNLLQIINSAYESKALLLMVGQQIKIFNLADLNSRLKNIFSTHIKQTSLENLKIIFTNILSRKQIFLKQNIVDNIFLKITPNYANIHFATQIIESYFNKKDEKISINRIMEYFK